MKHYQVLARKYRPRFFAELIGQTYIVKTLINALDTNSLHHGFLFTGTHGVGKTTIARILAKSINCEQGVSSKPCGKCTTCVDIDQGKSIDLIEIDAASHTGVEAMRDILENTHYYPTKSRFKIYIIDEVHMLSNSSFNALLKTLEEPPEHIKFLFATTNPKKIPVTVLSRCLQFTLQKLTNTEIVLQLKNIMQAEKLKYEEEPLVKIASLSNGSMRDAISLLDQSITYASGEITTKNIENMLSLVSHDDIIKLTNYLFAKNTRAVIDLAYDLYHKGENLGNALKDLMSIFHQISIAKTIPNSTDISDNIKMLSNKISNHDLQLFYQIAINGNKDLTHAPSEQIGFEMTLLRMITFHSSSITIAKEAKNKQQPKPYKKADPIPQNKKTKPSINNQQQWQDLAKSLSLNKEAKTLINNTSFNNMNNEILSIDLNEQAKGLLTENLRLAIQEKLLDKFGKITLKVNLIPTTKIQEQFLNDENVKKLEKIFNTKTNLSSIKEIKNV